MTVSAEIQAILVRLEAGICPNSRELQALGVALRRGQVSAEDHRTVAIGGSVQDSIIVTGDGNIVIKVTDAATLQALREILHKPDQPKRPFNECRLLDSVKEEVDIRLSQSLYNEVQINLNKEAQPGQVKRPWDSEIKIGEKPAEPIPESQSILDVFDKPEIRGKLLILGDPGAGKTTTLLELAQKLCERARQQIESPIPVLLNLSQWKDENQSIRDWVMEEVRLKHGVRKDKVEEWLRNGRILLMLDGLDELRSNLQVPCVQKLNHLFNSNYRPDKLVVCCRKEEYNNLLTFNDKGEPSQLKLQMNGAIILKPLKREQIKQYLFALKRPDIWNLIRNRSSFLNLVQTPLWLAILVLAEQELKAESWSGGTTHLLDAYVRQMLKRDVKSTAYRQRHPGDRKTKQWLKCLAAQMQRDSETEFLIEKLQASWLPKYQFWNVVYIALNRLLLGLFLAVNFGLISELISRLLVFRSHISLSFAASSVGFILGWSIKLTPLIKPVERLRWSWETSLDGVKQGFVYGIQSIERTFRLNFNDHSSYPKLQPWYRVQRIVARGNTLATLCVIPGLIIGAVLGVALGVMHGIADGTTLEDRSTPNQGIWRSLKSVISNTVIWASCFGLISFGLGLTQKSSQALNVAVLGSSFGLLIGIILSTNTGGQACVQHFVLRFILWCVGDIPWNYARFLDYSTDRLFLQRVGGRYRFIHRKLQEHFAAMPKED
jgi:DNA polymerase III delta prime subunit